MNTVRFAKFIKSLFLLSILATSLPETLFAGTDTGPGICLPTIKAKCFNQCALHCRNDGECIFGCMVGQDYNLARCTTDCDAIGPACLQNCTQTIACIDLYCNDTNDVTCETANTVMTYEFTGAPQQFVVPTIPESGSMSHLHIEAYGAQGGDGASGTNDAPGGIGGLGGFLKADIVPTPGSILNIFVGGAGSTLDGGFNGGGVGGTEGAGGGGGASDIRLNGTELVDRIVAAGGGGGAGRGGCDSSTVAGGAGGLGGGGVGQKGSDAATINGFAGGGYGGTLNSPGASGLGCGTLLGSPGDAPLGAVGGNGGAGQVKGCLSIPGGGGGGGGLLGGYGGGGGSTGTEQCEGNDKGAGGGGAGGSSGQNLNVGGIPASSNVHGLDVTSGVREGNGLLKICYTLISPTPTPTATATITPTATATRTATSTPTVTATSTVTPTSTATSTPTNTATAVPTSVPPTEVVPTSTPTSIPSPTTTQVVALSTTLKYLPAVTTSRTTSGFLQALPVNPKINVLSESDTAVAVKSCINFKSLLPSTANVYGVLKNVTSKRIVQKTRIHRDAPCLNLTFKSVGTYAFYFLQERFMQPTVSSKITSFIIASVPKT